MDNLLSSRENVVDFGILPNAQRLTVTRIFDQFWRKGCQKKGKHVYYKLLLEFIQKYFVVKEQSALTNSFITYVCYAPDGFQWLHMYTVLREPLLLLINKVY